MSAIDSIRAMKVLFPDLVVSTAMFGEGDYVASQFIWSSNSMGDTSNYSHQPSSVRFSGITLGRFDQQGRLVEQWELWDQLSQLQQLGVVDLGEGESLTSVINKRCKNMAQ